MTDGLPQPMYANATRFEINDRQFKACFPLRESNMTAYRIAPASSRISTPAISGIGLWLSVPCNIMSTNAYPSLWAYHSLKRHHWSVAEAHLEEQRHHSAAVPSLPFAGGCG